MHTCWTQGPSIGLAEILDAREQRVRLQQELLKEHPSCVVSFTLNIAGPIKVTPFTQWLYALGNRLIHHGVLEQKGQILKKIEEKKDTGWEGFFALSLKPDAIKFYLLFQEENHPLGRLFDFDVLRPDGSKVSRQELGFPERTCLICGKPAFLCGRSRTHSAWELQKKTQEMMSHFYHSRMSVHIGTLMQKALLYEVNTSLKPGLVDRVHNGAHQDMCIDTFVTSAYALTPYFINCALAGLSFDSSQEELPTLFQQLRILGKQAEETMLEAPNLPEVLSGICQSMVSGILEDYKGLTSSTARTHGEKLYASYSITGIRGEACDGFPHVLLSGYPQFQKAYKTTGSLTKAGLITLLYYIGNTEDTNLIIRSDYETATRIQKSLSAFLNRSDYEEQLQILPALDEYFVSNNISPGGSADMLALTYFLSFLSQKDCWFES